MCGFAGAVSAAHSSTDLRHLVESMCTAIVHRGPDDSGLWIDAERSIGLGHRRLSIIDLSAEGHQPMVSASGRFVIVFNGEIYNFKEIKAWLGQEGAAIQWRGHSDTEVLLAAIEHWGLRDALARANGMFALALYDREQKVLHLARDRMGEKPLYYGRLGKTFVFMSELKSIQALRQELPPINRAALALYMQYGCVPAPWSIYDGIYKLQPAHVLSIPLGELQDRSPAPDDASPYWSLDEVVSAGLSNPFRGSAREAADALEERLLAAVGLRMVADVPLGTFLSGGYDSSMITALMQAQSSIPVRTFSIGFDQDDHDEAPYAKAVARHLGTDHTEFYVSHKQAMDVVPLLPQVYCEPFADSSQIPTYLVSRLARRHVTVALSGDRGG